MTGYVRMILNDPDILNARIRNPHTECRTEILDSQKIDMDSVQTVIQRIVDQVNRQPGTGPGLLRLRSQKKAIFTRTSVHKD